MKRMLHWLMPKEKEFFGMLAEQSENCFESANELKNFVDNYHKFERKERKLRVQTIKDIKSKGDEIARKIITKLNKSFRAPINKEDIQKIVVLLGDLIDLINTSASRFVVFNIERIDSYIIKLIEIVLSAVSEVNKGVADLRKLKDAEERHSKIKNLEMEADDVYNEALSELFHFYKNSIDIIKYKEIYELLERAVGKCQDVSNAIEDIIAKHA